MIHRTYKIDVKFVEIRTYTVTVPKTPGHDDLVAAYEGALAAHAAGIPADRVKSHCETVPGSHDLVEEVKDPTIEFKNLAPAGTRYGWVITRDVLAEEDRPQDEVDPSDDSVIDHTNVYGPRDAVLTREQILEHGVEFQMLDDDGELYYEGKVAWAVDYKDGSGFEPLDDFGRPNAGCTEIRYKDTAGEWRAL